MIGDDSVIIGIDIGGTKVHAVAFDRKFTALADSRAATATSLNGNHDPNLRSSIVASPANGHRLADQVIGLIEDLVTRTDGRSLAAIGIGAPGMIDRERGSIVTAVNLGIAEHPLDLVDRIAGSFAVPCALDNDVNIGALGARQIIDPASLDMAYLSIGTGVAAGIILNGRLRRGRSGMAGEIGHFPVVTDGPRCECGLNGCLEAVASGAAIGRQWSTPSEQSPATALFKAADAGDAKAAVIRKSLCHHLALAVYLLTMSYDISPIVIGGGVAELGTELLEHIKTELDMLGEQSALVRSLSIHDRLLMCPDGPIGPVGAAVMAADKFSWSTS